MQQGTLRGLRHYLRRAPVAQIAAVVAIAKLSAAFLLALAGGAIVVPLLYPVGSPRFSFTFFGFTTLFGRTFNWLDPLGQLVSLAAVLALATVLRSRTQSSRRECPHCLTLIPAAAPVCFNCTRAAV